MINLFLSLFKKENISAILNIKHFECRDLHYVIVTYVKDHKTYYAFTYYTDVWITSNPYQPFENINGEFHMNSIQDVASILSSEAVADLDVGTKYLLFNPNIEELYATLDSQAKLYAESRLSGFTDKIYSVRFMLTPSPMCVVSFIEDGVFLGSLGVYLNGKTEILSYTSSKLLDIFNTVGGTAMLEGDVLDG